MNLQFLFLVILSAVLGDGRAQQGKKHKVRLIQTFSDSEAMAAGLTAEGNMDATR